MRQVDLLKSNASQSVTKVYFPLSVTITGVPATPIRPMRTQGRVVDGRISHQKVVVGSSWIDVTLI